MATIGEEIQKALEKGKGKGLLAVDLRMLIRKNEGFKEQIDVFLARDKTMQHVDLFHKQVERLLDGEPVEQILGESDADLMLIRMERIRKNKIRNSKK